MRRLLALAAAAFGLASPATADNFVTTNLVTDNQAANPAQVTDPNLVNAWGVSFGPTSPFWVSANGSGLATLYNVNPLTNATTIQGMVITFQGAGNVTGQVFNGTSAFNGDRFLFVSEDGTVSGWRSALGTQAERFQVASPDNNYKGTTLVTIGANTYLLSANFHSGNIDILKGTPGAPDLTGKFTDPNLPAGYAPFNIQLLEDKVYVTYAKQGSGGDEQAGAGLGIVDEFDTQGTLIRRVGSNGGTLNAPWGLAIAPSSFGSFAGDLLVGNFGDGTINAFDLSTNTFAGQLLGSNGNPLSIDGLWALTPGNGTNAGNTDTIYFSAGPNGETHGLFGAINLGSASPPTSVPGPSSAVLGLIAIGTLTARRRYTRPAGS
jgi:uncharacterized protein (TIGR03118 family)